MVSLLLHSPDSYKTHSVPEKSPTAVHLPLSNIILLKPTNPPDSPHSAVLRTAKMASSEALLSPSVGRPALRRLSSMTATESDIESGGSFVVVPERLMHRRAKTHHGSFGSFASAMETARNELSSMNLEDSSSPPESSPETPGTPIATPPEIPSADTFAFAFDIDGVLIRGGRPIPEAIEAMKLLNGENEFGVKV